jgi:hypothetical protein
MRQRSTITNTPKEKTMAETAMTDIDDTIDTQDDAGAGAAGADAGAGAGADGSAQAGTAAADGGDANAQLQNRMAGDDTPWYSPSEGKVVTPDGQVLIDPATNQPFRSMAEFQAWQAKQAPASTAKPKTGAAATQQKPMSRSFDSYVAPDGMTTERLLDLSKAGMDFSYKNDLTPKVDPAMKGTDAAAQIDPVERVRTERANIEAVTLAPLREIREALIKQGGNPQLVDQLLAPVLQKQQAMVDQHYQKALEDAMIQRAEGVFKPKLTQFEEQDQANHSKANINAIAQRYFPEGGQDAFFALINGHYDEKNQFQRGPSAIVVDLLAKVATGGKAFKTDADRNASYTNMFRGITADPAQANALADIAYFYWLGRQSRAAQAMVFDKGKQAGAAGAQRVTRTVKTRPASFGAPRTDDDRTKGMPNMLKVALGAQAT